MGWVEGCCRREDGTAAAAPHSPTLPLPCSSAYVVLHLGSVESREYNLRVQSRIFTFEELVTARMA